jgi:putative RNA 2'-phosphotransferase
MSEDIDQRFAPAELTALSRLLSKILRHEPELVAVKLDEQGWVRIDELLHGIRKAARAPGSGKRIRVLPEVTREMLFAVVAANDKRRFALSSDSLRIRAVQGHSIEVDLGHPTLEPPAVLFHGTAAASWRTISVDGLTRGTRHAVHLSADAGTAKRVGARHGRPVVLEVSAAQMHADGFQFSRSDNGVWLVAAVPPKYLKLRP